MGMGIGLSSMTIPMFISEVAPVDKRGTLTTLNVAFITGGQFIAACVDGALANVEEGWRYREKYAIWRQDEFEFLGCSSNLNFYTCWALLWFHLSCNLLGSSFSCQNRLDGLCSKGALKRQKSR